MFSYTFYIIRCKDETNKDCYVGMTKNFTMRKFQHKQCSKKLLNKKENDELDAMLYSTINEMGGWENWIMIPLLTTECCKIEALKKEQELIIEYKANLNTQIMGNSQIYKQEWYQLNREKIRLRQMKYRELNKIKKQINKEEEIQMKEIYNQKQQEYLEFVKQQEDQKRKQKEFFTHLIKMDYDNLIC